MKDTINKDALLTELEFLSHSYSNAMKQTNDRDTKYFIAGFINACGYVMGELLNDAEIPALNYKALTVCCGLSPDDLNKPINTLIEHMIKELMK